MATEGFEFILSRVLEGLGPVGVNEGGSGYFSTPDDHLDPRLFSEGDMFRPSVRAWILKTLYDYWDLHFKQPKAWSQVWVAGSGISYQWAADRSNGDLDVLIGVDWPKFWQANPEYQGFSAIEMGDFLNRGLKDDVWTQTDHVDFHVPDHPGAFEVTFYVNPTATDIRDIKPYAAYNLTTNTWTVRPPDLPGNPETLYPQEYWDYVHDERRLADSLVGRYNQLSSQLGVQVPGGPGWLNAIHQMGLVTDQARTLFDDIHLGRRNAFGPDGQGYGDFYNFRWQAHKRFGTVQALNRLVQARRDAKTAYEVQTYGAPIDSAEQVLTKAALWNRGGAR
jgi:hypothetical protein